MDPREILLVRFHFGGEFIKAGPNLDYVGGHDALSEIERKKLSLQEVKGFVKDHMTSKETIKLYFLIPGKDLVDGLVLLYDDTGCVEMAHYVRPGRVADVYVEYHGEEVSTPGFLIPDACYAIHRNTRITIFARHNIIGYHGTSL